MMTEKNNFNAQRVFLFFTFLLFVVFFLNFLLKNGDDAHNSSVIRNLEFDFEPVPVPSRNDRYKWRSSSSLTVVNYFSLDCPHCRELFALEDEKESFYKDNFSLIYRHSPLPMIQPLSGEKAVISECVREQSGDQGMFDFVGSLFGAYPKGHTSNEWVRSLALGFVQNREAFRVCLNGSGLETLEREREETLSYGVYGTPTIVVFKGTTPILRLDKTSARTAIRIMDALRDSE
jgi:thiol-disulfide isomerase/thioredoxin